MFTKSNCWTVQTHLSNLEIKVSIITNKVMSRLFKALISWFSILFADQQNLESKVIITIIIRFELLQGYFIIVECISWADPADPATIFPMVTSMNTVKYDIIITAFCSEFIKFPISIHVILASESGPALLMITITRLSEDSKKLRVTLSQCP